MTNRTDDFNRANSAITMSPPSDGLGNYGTTTGVAGITSNTGYWASPTAAQNIQWLEASISDFDFSLTFPTIGTDFGLAFRYVDINNYMLAIWTSGTGFRIFQVVANSFLQVGSTVAGSMTANDVLKITANGASLNFYLNGVSKISATNATHLTATKSGVRGFNDGAVRWDNLSITALSTGTNVDPGVGSLAITGYAPSIAQTANQAVAPGVGLLTITGYAPTVAQSGGTTVNPDVGTVAITGYAPTVAQTANQAISPGVGSITLTGYAPTVAQASASLDIVPDTGQITITGYAPDVFQTRDASDTHDGFWRRQWEKKWAKKRAQLQIPAEIEEKAAELVAEVVSKPRSPYKTYTPQERQAVVKMLIGKQLDDLDEDDVETLLMVM